jgi:hypothetical protein
VLMTGAFSLSLSVFQVGMLGCVAKNPAPLVMTAYGNSVGSFFSRVLLGPMGCLVQARSLKWSH